MEESNLANKAPTNSRLLTSNTVSSQIMAGLSIERPKLISALSRLKSNLKQLENLGFWKDVDVSWLLRAGGMFLKRLYRSPYVCSNECRSEKRRTNDSAVHFTDLRTCRLSFLDDFGGMFRVW